MIVSGLAGRFGVTTANSVVKPSLLFVSALQNATPAGPDFDPMTRSICATSLPSPTSDSPRKKSAAMGRAPVYSENCWGQLLGPPEGGHYNICETSPAKAG